LGAPLPEKAAIPYNARMSRPTILERAFELARTGEYSNVTELRRALIAEGFTTKQLEGRALQKQLRQVCADAKKAAKA
jgi:hypothetical protein